jgi:hypothetical protein
MFRHPFLSLLFLLSALSVEAQTSFNDKWTFWSDSHPTHTVITLPHDAMQTEQRRPMGVDGVHSGFYPGGRYHYEKTLNVIPEMMKQHITLHFGGVYGHTRVSINGQEVNCLTAASEQTSVNAIEAEQQTMHYGYTSFFVVADGKLHLGKNIIRVDVDNSLTPNSRWYSGAGIYRPVSIWVRNKEHIQDVQVKTLGIHPAKVAITTTHTDSCHIEVELFDGNKQLQAKAGDKIEMEVPKAHLWSANSPYLYSAVVKAMKGDSVVDVRRVDFGIRTLSWSPQGFFVNGQPVLLRGGCVHHDEGVIGAMECQEAADRRVAIMKKYGFNAIRSAHNPLSKEMLRACDRQGMYVMDELWDYWYRHKTEGDYAANFMGNYPRDIEAMVLKDYNHPCVVLYSIGNELSEPSDSVGLAVCRDIVGQLHRLDPTRPVTAGVNLTILGSAAMNRGKAKKGNANQAAMISALSNMDSQKFNQMMAAIGSKMSEGTTSALIDSLTSPMLSELDIAGYNYADSRYANEGRLHPERIVVGSETLPYDLPRRWEEVRFFRNLE